MSKKLGLKAGSKLMLMAHQGGGGSAKQPRAKSLGVMSARDALEQPAISRAKTEAESQAGSVGPVPAVAAATAEPPDGAVCRVAVAQGKTQHVLWLHRHESNSSGADPLAGLTMADVMAQLEVATGVPVSQQKLVVKGKVVDGPLALRAAGAKDPKSGHVASLKVMLMGTMGYHRAQTESSFLDTAAGEIATLESAAVSLQRVAAHGGGANDGGAELRVRHARLSTDAAALRNRLETTNWKGDQMEDEVAR